MPPGRSTRQRLAAAAIACIALLGAASPAGAATASQTVNAGSLSFLNSTPGDVTFPATMLSGADQVRTQSQVMDVGDATGSSSGWAITANATLFTAAGHTLDPVSTTIQTAPPAPVCLSGSTCTLATNAITYPYFLPAGSPTPPTATKMYNAAANTGMGNQKVTPTWSLALPATTWAGGNASPYTATWTFTLVSGP